MEESFACSCELLHVTAESAGSVSAGDGGLWHHSAPHHGHILVRHCLWTWSTTWRACKNPQDQTCCPGHGRLSCWRPPAPSSGCPPRSAAPETALQTARCPSSLVAASRLSAQVPKSNITWKVITPFCSKLIGLSCGSCSPRFLCIGLDWNGRFLQSALWVDLESQAPCRPDIAWHRKKSWSYARLPSRTSPKHGSSGKMP